MAIINDPDNSNLVLGTAFSDTIHGNAGDDDIYARSGNDFVSGDNGDDYLDGGRGNDVLVGGAGTNDLYGGIGADTFLMAGVVDGYSDDFIIDFSFDVDDIDVSAWGASSIDQLKFIMSTDRFGDATLNAFYNGFDHYLTIQDVEKSELVSRDFVFSELGAQVITGTAVRDTLFGSTEGDRIAASGGNDIVLGGRGNDVLNGGGGYDVLNGAAGRDVLTGSLGGDDLYGGAGSDIFVYRHLRDSTASNSDWIFGYKHGVDQIDLSDLDWNSDAAGTQTFDFIGGANFSAAGQLRFEQEGNDTVIYGNTDGDMAAEFRIVIDKLVNLDQSDFIL